jgi:hypothetical protein
MPRLKDRNHQIPGGFVHELGSLNWKSAPFSSFNTIVDQVHAIIQGNLSIARSRGWPTDRLGIERWVDESNATRCQQNGWNDFINPDQPMAEPPNRAEQWPLWARTIGAFRKEGEVGVGDTVKRVIGNQNSEAFKAWYKKTFNRDCGCCGRQTNLNNQYRY